MNRRGFLTTLGAFAATAVLDPEKLLWTPGKKTIFIPKAYTQPIWAATTMEVPFPSRHLYGLYDMDNDRGFSWQGISRG